MIDFVLINKAPDFWGDPWLNRLYRVGTDEESPYEYISGSQMEPLCYVPRRAIDPIRYTKLKRRDG